MYVQLLSEQQAYLKFEYETISY